MKNLSEKLNEAKNQKYHLNPHGDEYERKFKKWMNSSKVNSTLTTKTPVNFKPKFKIGDIVTFKNDYGMEFHNFKILAYDDEKPRTDKNWEYGRYYTNTNAYWFPIKEPQLTKQPKLYSNED